MGTTGITIIDKPWPFLNRKVTHKTIDRGATIAGVLMGSNRLSRFAHCNAAIQMRSTAYTHDLQVLGSLERFVALNSAIEVDLSGQINAETAGGTYVGAVGGGT